MITINKVETHIYKAFYVYVQETGNEAYVHDLLIDSDGGAFISHLYLEDDKVIHDKLLLSEEYHNGVWEKMCAKSADELSKHIHSQHPEAFKAPKPKKKTVRKKR